MPRTIPIGFRQATEARGTGIIPLVFLTVSHHNLSEPIRVVSDVADYVYGGDTYLGNFPFEAEILSDDENPPRTTLRVQNVDKRIGQVIQALATPPMIDIKIIASDDFDLTVKPRTEIGAASVIYRAPFLRLHNIRGDAMAIEGDLAVWDPTTEPYPSIRATPDRLPGLFR